MRPVLDNFEPFSVEMVPLIRAKRLEDLSNPDKPRRGAKKAAAGPRLMNKTKEVIAGLDPKTQAILNAMLGKK